MLVPCFHVSYRMEYLTAKMSKAKDEEKKELQMQIALLETDIGEIRSYNELLAKIFCFYLL